MDAVISFLFLAVTLAISGVLQPGPMTALVISQSIRHGIKEGVKVSIAPIITDGPIILLVIFLLSKFSDSNTLIGIISLLGAIYLTYLAYGNLTVKVTKLTTKNVSPQSFKKGILTNALNPAPYLFWLTLGAAMLSKASQIAPWMPFVYLLVAYGTLVGGYAALAFLAGKFSKMLESKVYIWIIRIMGVALGIFGITFFIRALHLLKVLS